MLVMMMAVIEVCLLRRFNRLTICGKSYKPWATIFSSNIIVFQINQFNVNILIYVKKTSLFSASLDKFMQKCHLVETHLKSYSGFIATIHIYK